MVEKQFPKKKEIKIIKEASDDKRSYHINSDKIKKILNFSAKRSIENAVEDLCDAFIKKNLTIHSLKIFILILIGCKILRQNDL